MPTHLKVVAIDILLFQTLDEALQKNVGNTHPYIIIVGTSTAFSSAVCICNKKVITCNIGKFIFSSVLTLLAVHYAYELSYHPEVQQVLEFFQEKLMGDCTKKVSTSLSNLIRAVTCIEQKMEDNEELTASREERSLSREEQSLSMDEQRGEQSISMDEHSDDDPTQAGDF